MSYWLVERPALRLQARFRRRLRAASAPNAPVLTPPPGFDSASGFQSQHYRRGVAEAPSCSGLPGASDPGTGYTLVLRLVRGLVSRNDSGTPPA